MSERLNNVAAVVAGAGLLVSCSGEQTSPPPPELIVAHQTEFGESETKDVVSNVVFTPLEIGSRVVGICVLDTRDEIGSSVNSGFMRVRWENRIGTIRTFEPAAPGEFVDTFKGMSESSLVATFGRCDDSPQEK